MPFQKGHPNYLKRHSKETRQRMSEIAKKKGFGKWMKGKRLTEETKRKIGEASKGNKHNVGNKNALGHKKSMETRKKQHSLMLLLTKKLQNYSDRRFR